MNRTAEKILEILEKNCGQSISGEKIAEEINVSRNAVWKNVKLLQAKGYNISAVTNRGYALSEDTDLVNEMSIRAEINGKNCKFGQEIHAYNSVSSTNDVAKDLAQKGAAEGTIVVADNQNSGKGRMDRPFFSPENSGVYISIVLRPKIALEKSLFITTCAAVAVARTIERLTSLRAEIKWVNDVYVGKKKVCGILTEAALDFESRGLQYAILGIGVNVRTKDFPENIKDIATSIFLESGVEVRRSTFIATLLEEFEKEYANLENADFLQEYRNRSNVIGRRITVISGASTEEATAIEIDEEFRLVVRTEEGEVKTLNSGEVSVRAMNN